MEGMIQLTPAKIIYLTSKQTLFQERHDADINGQSKFLADEAHRGQKFLSAAEKWRRRQQHNENDNGTEHADIQQNNEGIKDRGGRE